MRSLSTRARPWSTWRHDPTQAVAGVPFAIHCLLIDSVGMQMMVSSGLSYVIDPPGAVRAQGSLFEGTTAGTVRISCRVLPALGLIDRTPATLEISPRTPGPNGGCLELEHSSRRFDSRGQLPGL
ncbi:MAG: hypothetical protein U1E65_05440 [Myxococcota bacterium]